ncbi:hypothetical protein IF1G_04977 [Cordyceps javanica]|uniref:Uncharacterized protein n=1 Tax=Cordyceps javanica TaxID=43265 RepID=A0A545V3V6_9HYPO|nr:hypothetical protein IF1G_04977 [Cordyceps javanica]TQW07690.1 hypothetical protein IF2G_04851 [Cordyceps javanica]
MDSSLSVVLQRATTELTQHQPSGLGTWSEYFISGASMWFTTCIGSRKPARHHTKSTSSTPASPAGPPLQEKAGAATMKPKPRMPQHAASSFLKTGTSRAIREANEIM